MIDWQFKIMDYVYDMLESLPYGTAAIISKEELHKHVCPEREIWCPLGSRHYLTYKTFTDALRAAERDFSLKIHTGTLDEENWESEYICIQKKDRKN